MPCCRGAEQNALVRQVMKRKHVRADSLAMEASGAVRKVDLKRHIPLNSEAAVLAMSARAHVKRDKDGARLDSSAKDKTNKGKLRHLSTNDCMVAMTTRTAMEYPNDDKPNEGIEVTPLEEVQCDHPGHTWYEDIIKWEMVPETAQIRLQGETMCVTGVPESDEVVARECLDSSCDDEDADEGLCTESANFINQQWHTAPESSNLVRMKENRTKCLAVPGDGVTPVTLNMQECNESDTNQKWDILADDGDIDSADGGSNPDDPGVEDGAIATDDADSE